MSTPPKKPSLNTTTTRYGGLAQKPGAVDVSNRSLRPIDSPSSSKQAPNQKPSSISRENQEAIDKLSKAKDELNQCTFATDECGVGAASSLSQEILTKAYQTAIEKLIDPGFNVAKGTTYTIERKNGDDKSRTIYISCTHDGTYKVFLDPENLRYDGTIRDIKWNSGTFNICTPIFCLDESPPIAWAKRTMELNDKTIPKFENEKKLNESLNGMPGGMEEIFGPEGAESRSLFSKFVRNEAGDLVNIIPGNVPATFHTEKYKLDGQEIPAYKKELIESFLTNLKMLHTKANVGDTVGVAHNDLKLEHLLVRQDSENKITAMIIDFDTVAEKTDTEYPTGTEEYWSPRKIQTLLALAFGIAKDESLIAKDESLIEKNVSIELEKVIKGLEERLKQANESSAGLEKKIRSLQRVKNSYGWHLLMKQKEPLKYNEFANDGSSDVFAAGLIMAQLVIGTKLKGISNVEHDKEFFKTLDAIIAAHPTGVLANSLKFNSEERSKSEALLEQIKNINDSTFNYSVSASTAAAAQKQAEISLPDQMKSLAEECQSLLPDLLSEGNAENLPQIHNFLNSLNPNAQKNERLSSAEIKVSNVPKSDEQKWIINSVLPKIISQIKEYNELKNVETKSNVGAKHSKFPSLDISKNQSTMQKDNDAENKLMLDIIQNLVCLKDCKLYTSTYAKQPDDNLAHTPAKLNP